MRITVACDVDNPLFGPDGAAFVFGPQKGATPGQVRLLDESLRRLAVRLDKLDSANTPGAGAAGGLGFGMLAFFGATLRSGVDLGSRRGGTCGPHFAVPLCALPGEGRLDSQTCAAKPPRASPDFASPWACRASPSPVRFMPMQRRSMPRGSPPRFRFMMVRFRWIGRCASAATS